MAKTHIKSTSLEHPISLTPQGVLQIFTRYSLVWLCIFFITLFSFTTDSFASLFTLNAILETKSKIALLALAATITMIVGKIDLNVGFGIVLWHILAITFQVQYGLSWQMSVLLVLTIGAIYGLLNGVLVAFTDIDSFVATLGSGTTLYALALWHTEGRQIVGELPDAFIALNSYELFGLPVSAFYVMLVAIILWLITEHSAIGRKMYAVGSNPTAAYLNGINVKKYTIYAFIASSTLTAFTGILIAAQQGVGQASVGIDYLLPALVGAFLGSTTIRPGRVNVWGTIVGIALLAIGISGIQQFGGAFWVEPLFNGITLLLAITIVGYAQRKRLYHPKNKQKSIKNEN